MYNKNRVKRADNVTLEYILSKVTEYDIYEKYLGKFKVGMIYNSPFRKDKNPSFGLYYARKSKQLLFKDHGTGDCGNIIKFVSLYTGLTNYNDILKDIINKLNITSSTKLDKTKLYSPSTDTVIGIVRQSFSQNDLNYWNNFGITEKTLKLYDVFAIKYYLCNGIVKGIYKDENPMYAYKVYNNFKIYRPLADKYTKWRNNLTEYDIQGFKQLPKKGDILFITKSLKDVMVLHEMGYPAISPSSESTFIPKDALEDVLKRFKRIFILFDRDISGVKQSRKLSLKTGLTAMFIHKKFHAKDISDAVKNNNFITIKNWLDETTNKNKKIVDKDAN